MKLTEIKTERLTLREMNTNDWKEYVSHVVEADEIYVQYGCEATKELLNEIQEPTQGVIYYSIRRSDLSSFHGTHRIAVGANFLLQAINK